MIKLVRQFYIVTAEAAPEAESEVAIIRVPQLSLVVDVCGGCHEHATSVVVADVVFLVVPLVVVVVSLAVTDVAVLVTAVVVGVTGILSPTFIVVRDVSGVLAGLSSNYNMSRNKKNKSRVNNNFVIWFRAITTIYDTNNNQWNPDTHKNVYNVHGQMGKSMKCLQPSFYHYIREKSNKHTKRTQFQAK